MYIQVFHTHDAELMKAVHAALKEKFITCMFTVSAIEGKPIKLNLEGAEDEREKAAYANTFAKQWLKDKQAESEKAKNSTPVAEKNSAK